MLGSLQGKKQHADCYQQAGFMPAASNCVFTGGSLLQLGPEVGGGSSRVGVHQITRSHSAKQVAGFGQMFALVFGGKKRCVPTGSRGTPGNVFATLGENLEGPAGIDSFDGAEGDSVASEDVYESNRVFIEANFWIEKENPGKLAKQKGRRQAFYQGPKTKLGKGLPQSKTQHKPHHYGKALAELRSKNLHPHNDSLTTGVFA